MALITRERLCSITGVKSKDISNYIKRNHLFPTKTIPGGAEYFDTANEFNAAFIIRAKARIINAMPMGTGILNELKNKYRISQTDMQLFSKKLSDFITKAADELANRKAA